MLAKEGVKIDGAGKVILTVCAVCFQSLSRKALPKCAVANNFAIGGLPPEFDDTTWMEYAVVRCVRLFLGAIGRLCHVCALAVRVLLDRWFTDNRPIVCDARLWQLTPVHRISYIIHYRKVNGVRIPNGQASLLGHVFSQRLDVAEVFNKLPLKTADVKIRVLISASYTPEQKRLTLKPYEIRQVRVLALFNWLKQHNPTLYGDVQLDTTVLAALPQNGYLPDVIEVGDPPDVSTDGTAANTGTSDVSSAAASAVDSSHVMSDNSNPSVPVTAPSDDGPTAVAMSQSILVPRPHLTDRSTVVKLRAIIDDTTGAAVSASVPTDLSSAAVASSSAAAAALPPAAAAASQPANAGVVPSVRVAGRKDTKKIATYDVISSSEPYWMTDTPWLAKTFINLYPFGRGGLDEVRVTKISIAACIEHYQRLASRRFQRPDFVLHVYDMLARMRMGDDTFVKARMNIRSAPDRKDFTNSFGTISVDTLQAAANYLTQKANAAAAGRVQPLPPVGMDAAGSQILRTIEQVAGVCEHTPEFAVRMRSRIFGYSSYFGPATWWYVCVGVASGLRW